MAEKDFNILKQLTEIQSCSGNEGKIRKYILQLVEKYCDKVEVDTLGNLHCFINGKKEKDDGKLKILLDAHMDEIGFIVRYIDKNGFIRFSQIGGQNVRILPGQIVTIHSSSGNEIIGIIGEKPIHLIEQEEKKKTSKIEDLFIDIGMENKKEVEKFVSIGDYITLKQECTNFYNKNRFFSKAFDDRAGCFVLIKLIELLAKEKDNLDKDLIFQFASQEEIGVRGATVGAYKISPDLAIVVEVTHAIDFPGINKEKFQDIKLGNGPTISVGPNIYPKLSKILIDIAKEKNIPFVIEARPRPLPNDARIIQITKSGIPCAALGIPLRYMHTNVEVIDYKDIIYTIDLLKEFLLEDLAKLLANNK
ncbi:MAG: M42 family metallopeptidase [Promethearchaeia archaeon]